MGQFVHERIIGIAFGEQEICVCAHFQDQIVEVLRLPAVFTVSPVGEVLTGSRGHGIPRSAVVRVQRLRRSHNSNLSIGI